MIVTNLRRECRHGSVRLAADIVHETAPVPVVVIYYEVEEVHAELLAYSYDPFLIAALLPAILHRETRVAVDGSVAPLLVSGLQCVMAWHHVWFGTRHAPIAIEVSTRDAILPSDRTAAMHLSGGVDSLFTLRRNQLWYPASHRCRVTHAILVNGFDIRRPEAFRIARERLLQVTAEAGIELVTVTSNVPILDDDYSFWTRQFGGAGFCSVAHALSPAFRHVFFSANVDIPKLFPWSLHPATDHNYSSADLEISQDGVEFTRLEKVQILAQWDVALRHMRVCTKNPVNRLNCGVCEKCIRTQLALLVAGRLAEASAFPNADISAEQVRAVRIRNEGQHADHVGLAPALRRFGRPELAEAVESILGEYHHWVAWRDGTGLKHRVARALHLRQ